MPGKMRVIAFIEDPDVVKNVLQHLDLWDFKKPPRPVAQAAPIIQSPAYDDIPQPSVEDYIADPVYPMDAYLCLVYPMPPSLHGGIFMRKGP
ncbi:MAG: hypothetical protein JRI76_06925 [Deltaproteobacteria bacterium]|nr:hypothetical protein [Deltaproteobacteria bacterium]MBW2041753.1 hypothetical protein [Deltaproteobacteria bacterium]MBW2132136.1 hypothetical protein [Deltaproteobacteria bacterium]